MKSHDKLSVTPSGGVEAEGKFAITFASLIILVALFLGVAIGRGSAIVEACLNWKLF